MKTLFQKINYKLGLLTLSLLAAASSYAQTGSDTLTSADYHYTMPKHLDPMYNGPLRYVVMGVLVLAILYMAFRYFTDNRIHTGHEPHHQ